MLSLNGYSLTTVVVSQSEVTIEVGMMIGVVLSVCLVNVVGDFPC